MADKISVVLNEENKIQFSIEGLNQMPEEIKTMCSHLSEFMAKVNNDSSTDWKQFLEHLNHVAGFFLSPIQNMVLQSFPYFAEISKKCKNTADVNKFFEDLKKEMSNGEANTDFTSFEVTVLNFLKNYATPEETMEHKKEDNTDNNMYNTPANLPPD